MKKGIATKIAACSVSAVLGLGFLAGCGGNIPTNKDALVIMTEELNELYNPFYSTAGTDMDVVGQTQISMLTTNENGALVAGDDEPTVVLDWEKRTNQPKNPLGEENSTTEYYFVLKNGLKFSDGTPVTMNDVLFNLYVYLDPAYTGSTTMYSTAIIGLARYRSQSTDTNQEAQLASKANDYATNRRQEMLTLYHDNFAQGSGANVTYLATPDQMRALINETTPGKAYMQAIGETDPEKARAQLLADYNDITGDPDAEDGSDEAKGRFRLELESDFRSAKEAFTEEPYKSAEIRYEGKKIATGFDEITSFMYNEGLATVKHPQEEGKTQDLTKIEYVDLNYDPSTIKTQEDAINRVYNTYIPSEFDNILTRWATGTEVFSDYVAKAKDIILHGNLKEGELRYKNIEGIRSLGHMENALTDIEINGKSYPIANYANGDYNEDGSVKDPSKYAVLRIVVDGNDPKAEWNFSFTVAPCHYYSDPEAKSSVTQEHLNSGDTDDKVWNNIHVDIANDQFGVVWASFDFHKSILQGENTWGVSKNKVPLGAGPYIATDVNDSDKPTATGFYSNQIVYYKSNPHFSLDGKTSSEPKIEHMHYQVISSSNALSTLESGQVHFVEPQFTVENYEEIADLESKGVGSVSTWQLGYGYIGINAGYIKQLNLRKALMAAMDTSLALEYYSRGTAVTIGWPMSAVSWAYPRETGYDYDGANPTAHRNDQNGKDYMTWNDNSSTETAESILDKYPKAVAEIVRYVQAARAEVNGGNLDLDITFTIAGSNMYEHPAYLVFKKAMDILNAIPDSMLGGQHFTITLKPDASALMKLSTGSLEVWAAAWGSTIDPDMYQVYHKNSTATSVLAWGYDDILNDSSGEYKEERDTLDTLATYIDAARKIDSQKDYTDGNGENQPGRISLYKTAMGLVLDLAVEMPLYQRQTLYAYNLNVIKKETLPESINSYTSPLSKIWEVEFTD